MTRDELIKELGNLAIRFSEGWHEGIKIDASDIMLFNQIAEALAQPEQEKQFSKFFAKMKLENEPCSEVLALGQMMREWLQHQVSDNGSCVDTGKGFSEYDLWVMCEGKELLITIKEKK